MGFESMYLVHNGSTDIGSDVLNVTAGLGLDTTTNSLQINYLDNSDWDDFFTEDDKIELYLKNGKIDKTSPSADDLIISANVQKLEHNVVNGREVLTVDCVDRTIVFNSQLMAHSFKESNGYYVARSGGDENNSIVHWIVAQINYANQSNDNWEDITMGTIDTTPPPKNMSAVEYASAYKTYGEVLKELAQGAYTNDKIYYFYLDSQNRFNWIEKTDNVHDSLTQGTDAITRYKFGKEVYDVVNAAVFNAGSDLHGTGIWWYAVNEVSASDIGFRWTFYSDVRLSDNQIANIYDVSSEGYGSGSTWTDNSQSWTTDEHVDSYLIIDGVSRGFKILSNTATTLTIAGEANYGDASNLIGYKIYSGGNDQYRQDVKNAALNIVKAKLAATAKLRFRGNVSVRGTNSFVPGQVWNVALEKLGWTASSPKKIRATDVDHTYSADGWTTEISLKEDEGTEGEAL